MGGISTERAFVARLARRGHIRPRQILAWLGFVLTRWPAFGRHVLKKNKAYLADLEVATVWDLAREFVEAEIPTRLRREVCAQLDAHRHRGDRVVLLTGTPEFIAAPLARLLGADDYRATRCASRDGRFLPAPPLEHPFGPEKLLVARALCAEHGVSLDQAVAYADSASDLALLEAVGHPVAVAADPRLRAVARERRWEMLGGGV